MPEICRFYGIIIFMNFLDHDPPHFHAWYGEYRVSVSIKDQVIRGEMPARALNLVFEWLSEHKEELLLNWQNSKNGKPLLKIDPLI
ncbi:MAG: DUF4160 domain-containing protein [Bacteroidetes bacterium]|nr:DUF4160 domain-containing protein [Bacteroidota bacterium]